MNIEIYYYRGFLCYVYFSIIRQMSIMGDINLQILITEGKNPRGIPTSRFIVFQIIIIPIYFYLNESRLFFTISFTGKC